LCAGQAGADLVWCNDYDRRNNTALTFNLVNALSSSSSSYNSSSSDSSSSNNSSSSTGSKDVEVCVQQWSAQAEVLKYEGIRGYIKQWQHTPQLQQQQLHIEQQHVQGDVQSHEQQQQQGQGQQQDQQGVRQMNLPSSQQQQQQQPVQQQQVPDQQHEQQQRVRVSHVEAGR
jgi:hypothetical protein